MKTTVIYHSADFDGLFCREIARKFLPDAELIGWDFKDAPIAVPDGRIYILDLPVDRVFGINIQSAWQGCFGADTDLIWIDHHKSSIESHPTDIPGYRIEGVAACRLAWQWFNHPFNGPATDGERSAHWRMWMAPKIKDFIDRNVSEPLAVRLAGEYDIFDKRDLNAELFQHGLKSQSLGASEWKWLLDCGHEGETFVGELLEQGSVLEYARYKEYRDVITQQGFDLSFEGIKFLACNSHNADIRSQLFEAAIKDRHEALLGFSYNGNGTWRVSMYRIDGKEKDILAIAKKFGGGGHPGACGFVTKTNALPFEL